MKKIFVISTIVGLLSVAGVALAAPAPTPTIAFKPTCFISVAPMFMTGAHTESVLVIWQSVFAVTGTFKATNPSVLFSSTHPSDGSLVTVDTTKNTTFTLTGVNGTLSTTCSSVLKAK